jgi:hypothetical protein
MRITTRVELLFHRIGILLAVPLVAVAVVSAAAVYRGDVMDRKPKTRVFHPNKAECDDFKKDPKENSGLQEPPPRDAAFDAVLTELARRQIIACSATDTIETIPARNIPFEESDLYLNSWKFMGLAAFAAALYAALRGVGWALAAVFPTKI